METERLVIDRLTEGDREDYFNNISHDKKVLETFICRYAESLDEFDFAPYLGNESLFAIRLKETGRLIGIILYFDEKDGECEIGYGLGSGYWGMGYAAEAAKRFIRYLFDEKGMHTVCASFFTGNEASRRVMEKCGMTFSRFSEKELEYLGVERDLTYYSVSRGAEGRPKVYLNDPIAPSAVERLKRHVELVDNFERPQELDAIILRQQYCPGSVIRRAVRCRLIQQHGTGLDRIDVSAANEMGIPVKNTPGRNARSVAEYALAMMLELSRRVGMIDRKTRAGLLSEFGMPETVGREMTGKRLGLIGSGHVARELAQIARDGFRMELMCYNPNRTERELAALGMKKTASLEQLMSCCDYVSVHCGTKPELHHMINAGVLSHAKPGLIFINTARGGLVDEEALYNALKSGVIAGAGLDVFEHEPPSPDEPLLGLENFVAGMHVGGSTYEAMERNGKAVVDSVFAALGIEG